MPETTCGGSFRSTAPPAKKSSTAIARGLCRYQKTSAGGATARTSSLDSFFFASRRCVRYPESSNPAAKSTGGWSYPKERSICRERWISVSGDSNPLAAASEMRWLTIGTAMRRTRIPISTIAAVRGASKPSSPAAATAAARAFPRVPTLRQGDPLRATPWQPLAHPPVCDPDPFRDSAG